MYSDLPHVICLSEHHLKSSELSFVNIEYYTIGAHFSRALHEGGGVIIYVHNSLKFINIDLNEYCQEKDIEICAIKIKSNSLSLCILALYRAPSGNFVYFLQNLDNILHSLYSPSTQFIICGDLNINYLLENVQKKQLENLLLIYNLMGIADFPMRISHISAMAIDNICIDITCYEDYQVIPFINDLTDHNAQLLTIKIPVHKQADRLKSTRKVNKHTILDFIIKLSF